MLPEAYQRLASREGTYWFHRARRVTAAALLGRYGLAHGCRWLDIGCGTGGNFAFLDAYRPSYIAGFDLSPIALKFAKANAPLADIIESDVNERFPFDDASFDVVTDFNVLYHGWVRSEATVLQEIGRVLRPGGLFLMTEPAFGSLRRQMDIDVGGIRRYEQADFGEWLTAAGLTMKFASYFTTFGYVILRLAGIAPKWSCKASGTTIDLAPINPLVNRALEFLALIEGKLLTRGFRLPFGTTLIIVAQRQRIRS